MAAGGRRRGGKLRCLVTGGSGFLGRHLVAQLAASGQYDVTVFDIRAVEDGSAPEGVVYAVGDLRSAEEVDRACAGAVPRLQHLCAGPLAAPHSALGGSHRAAAQLH